MKKKKITRKVIQNMKFKRSLILQNNKNRKMGNKQIQMKKLSKKTNQINNNNNKNYKI